MSGVAIAMHRVHAGGQGLATTDMDVLTIKTRGGNLSTLMHILKYYSTGRKEYNRPILGYKRTECGS